MTAIGVIIWTAFTLVFLVCVAYTVDTAVKRHKAKRVNHAINRIDKR